jgi:hypothetical protein
MRLGVRLVPWLLALIGLAIPLVGSGFALAPLVTVWLVILSLIWIVGRRAIPRGRGPRVWLAVGLVPLLLAATWEGGIWLIPADLAWLFIELVGIYRTRRDPTGADATS